MKNISYRWDGDDDAEVFELAYVEGTHGQPYSFGEEADWLLVEVQGFYIGILPVTQGLWAPVMGGGENPSVRPGQSLPLENVSWDEILRRGGFLDRINGGPAPAA